MSVFGLDVWNASANTSGHIPSSFPLTSKSASHPDPLAATPTLFRKPSSCDLRMKAIAHADCLHITYLATCTGFTQRRSLQAPSPRNHPPPEADFRILSTDATSLFRRERPQFYIHSLACPQAHPRPREFRYA